MTPEERTQQFLQEFNDWLQNAVQRLGVTLVAEVQQTSVTWDDINRVALWATVKPVLVEGWTECLSCGDNLNGESEKIGES